MATASQEESLSTDIIQGTHGKEVKPSFSTVTYTHVHMYNLYTNGISTTSTQDSRTIH